MQSQTRRHLLPLDQGAEDNVTNICTKNLQGSLFKKHSDKLVKDVVFFTQCNAQTMGRENISDGFYTRCNTTIFPRKKPIPRWRSRANRETRMRMPLGYISEYSQMIPYVGPAPNRKRYREIEWWGNRDRIDHYIKRIVHGPIQKCWMKRHSDRTGTYIIPDNRKKILIKKFMTQMETL